jgi:hypothetical protein
MPKNYIFQKFPLIVFAYITMILVMISGGVDSLVIEVMTMLTFFTLLSSLYLILTRRKYYLFLIYSFFLILAVLFFVIADEINYESRFFGGGNFDSSFVATLKLLIKILILCAFFPINSYTKVWLKRAMSLLIFIFFFQVVLTTFVVNIVKIPIDEIRFLFPFIGGVAEHEPHPLYIFGRGFDSFTYYRPRFYFHEPSGFGYAMIIIFFTRLLLGGIESFKISILAFTAILITISKAAIIVFLSYFLTKLILKFSFRNKIIFFSLLLSSLIMFIFILYILIGEYALWRVSVLANSFFDDLILTPRGVNASLLAAFEDGKSRDFTFYSIYYDLGILIGSGFFLIIFRLFFNLSSLNYYFFSKLFPIFIAYIFFLFSGSNYSSGGGLILFVLLYTQTKSDSNQALFNTIGHKL